MTGYVTHLNRDSNYGFIKPYSGGPDLFFHENNLAPGVEFGPQLRNRDVEFSVAQNHKGPVADKVKPI